MATTAVPLLTHNISWNSTFNNTFTYHFTGGLCQLQTTAGVYVYAIFLTALALAATVENIVVLLVMYRNSILRQPSILILGILAFVDLITASVVTPIKIWLTLIEAHWGTEEFTSMRNVHLHFSWLFHGVVFFSLSTVLMISIDRFLCVFLLERYKLTKKGLLVGLIIAWCIPLVITVCLAAQHYTSWLGWLLLAYFFFCIVSLIAAYIGMVLMLKRHRSTITNSTSLCFRKSIEDERRSVNTTLIIICACLAMNMPPIVAIGSAFTGNISRTLCAFTYVALLGNAAVNPIIYCSRVPVIRRHVLQMLGVKALRKCEDESEDYMTFVAEGEKCNIYTGPRSRSKEDDG